MSFYDVMQNLAVGIAGGIYSSIIVSVVFYLLNEYQNELNAAINMTYPLQGVVVMGLTKNVKTSKKFKRNKIAKKYFIEAVDNFDKFEPWKFKYEIKEIMCDIYEILTDGKYYFGKWDDDIIEEVSEKIENNLDKLEQCEKDFAKGFIKRVFRNKIIQTMGLFFVMIVLIA